MEGLDAPDGSPSGCADDQVFERFEPLRSGGTEPTGGCGVVGCGGADVPSLAFALREDSARFVIFCTLTWTDHEHPFGHAASSMMFKGRKSSPDMAAWVQR